MHFSNTQIEQIREYIEEMQVRCLEINRLLRLEREQDLQFKRQLEERRQELQILKEKLSLLGVKNCFTLRKKATRQLIELTKRTWFQKNEEIRKIEEAAAEQKQKISARLEALQKPRSVFQVPLTVSESPSPVVYCKKTVTATTKHA